MRLKLLFETTLVPLRVVVVSKYSVRYFYDGIESLNAFY